MISLFSYNKSLSEEENGKKFEPFINKKMSKELASELDGLSKRYNKISNKNDSFYKMLLNFFFTMSTLIIILSIVSIVSNGFEKSLNSLWILWIVALVFILSGISIMVVRRIKKKKIIENPEVKKIEEDTKNFIKKRNEFFGIPEDSILVDVAVNLYKMKDGVEVLANPSGFSNNFSLCMYRKGEQLFLNDNNFEYLINLSEIKSLDLISKKISFMYWNKDESPTSVKYRNYVKQTSIGFSVRQAGQLVFSKEDIDYEITVLPFDFDEVKKLLKNHS